MIRVIKLLVKKIKKRNKKCQSHNSQILLESPPPYDAHIHIHVPVSIHAPFSIHIPILIYVSVSNQIN